MQIASIGFLVGVLICQYLAVLPPLYWLLASSIVIPVIALFPKLRFFTFLALGFVYAAIVAHGKITDQFEATLEGKDLLLSGVIASLPKENEHRVQFQLDVLDYRVLNSVESTATVVNETTRKTSSFRILLNWYQPRQSVQVGERWQFVVRLKRPHGFANPGGFDYEAWLFQQNIVAKGYIVQRQETKPLNRYVGDANSLFYGLKFYGLNQGRALLREQLHHLMPENPYKGFVTALTIGDRQALTPEHWNVLLRTGTNHLMAISGLHIGLIAGLMFFVGSRLWRYIPGAVDRLPAPKAGAAFAVTAAFGYAALAGFAIPTQRAFIMIAVVMLVVWLQRSVVPSRTLAMALMAVLLFDPLAVINPGFWLSFCAVATILYTLSGRLSNTGIWWKWGRVQWVVSIGLAPLLMIVFQNIPVVSPLANLLAVPWVSMITVPLSLLGGALALPLPWLAEPILQLAGFSLAALWPLLSALSSIEVLQWSVSKPPAWTIIPAMVGTFWLLAPNGLPARWLGLIWMAPLFYASKSPLPYGAVQFTLLDVGQGLAAVIQTQSHTLVYDTGPRFGEHFDTGSAVIVPFLKGQGIKEIDTLILSHNDIDHVGGYRSINKQLMVNKVMATQEVNRVKRDWERCQYGLEWRWDGVAFRVMHPDSDYKSLKDNNNSCVLQVETQGGTVLLSGDIEQVVETHLIQTFSAPESELQAQVLVAPHHGSRSSSSEAFLAAVRPEYALFAVGYRNRYGLPKQDIVARYTKRGIKVLDTVSSGAISFTIGTDTRLLPQSYRQEHQRYWHRPKAPHSQPDRWN